jgi:hypothetical protein
MPKKRPTKRASAPGLVITESGGGVLSDAQGKFNRAMKRLESERGKLQRKQAQLDDLLVVATRELVPLVEQIKRTDRDLVFLVAAALGEVKLSKKRNRWLKDLVCRQAAELLDDPCGLSDEDLAKLEATITEIQPKEAREREAAEAAEEFEYLRGMMEDVARGAGVDLDFSNLDPTMDFDELEREMTERLRAACEAADQAASTHSRRPARKPTKAQAEKARKLAEQEEARKRDLKSLYKQLAKALHPDLEPDPQLKEHKEIWMKRLTGAYSGGDLRELLQIEMEWLGEEASNLATAGDAKLRVYCAVLKEQIADIQQQALWLADQPKYSPLRRFSDPYFGSMPVPAKIKANLNKELKGYREMLKGLEAGDPQRRQLLEQWADHHERIMRSSDIPF